MNKPKLPVICPSCSESLKVSQLACPECSTTVSGHYSLPLLLRLTEEEQNFVLQFFITSGSLKEMAAQTGVSYPTVRNRLDDVIAKIQELQSEQ